MKQYTAGFLGAGNMGGALAQAAIRTAGAENVILTCKTEVHTRAAAERLGCASGPAAEIVRSSRFVFLGVKPQMLSALAEELGGVIGEAECVLVSMLAGVTLERLEALFPGKRILRIMPNTPCAVGSGMLFLCRGSLAAEQDAEAFRQLMACAGRIDEIPEKWMDAASAVAGSVPPCSATTRFFSASRHSEAPVTEGRDTAMSVRACTAASADRAAPRAFTTNIVGLAVFCAVSQVLARVVVRPRPS